MNFRTLVDIQKYNFEINHTHKCMFIGSCFSENIGEKLSSTKIDTLVNPTGIHYNPYSIANTIESIINMNFLNEDDLFFSNGVWNNYNFHSRFSNCSKEETLLNINNAIKKAHEKFKSLDYLFITFGTSYVYLLNENKKVVSNCHKQPANIFLRQFLSPQEITIIWKDLISKIKNLNPNIKIIFTVSPIRHWKDGATNNAFSKSSLLLSIKELIDENIHSNLYYFPAFEIVNDELRDYRFYADDMLHPSNIAIEYIWEKFCCSFFDKKTIELNKRIKKITTAANHKVFFINTKEHKDFCNKMLYEIEKIDTELPDINMDDLKIRFNMK